MNKKLRKFLCYSLLVATVSTLNLPSIAGDIVADAITVETSTDASPYGNVSISNSGIVNNAISIEIGNATLNAENDLIQNSGSISVNTLNNSGKILGYNDVSGNLNINGDSTNTGIVEQNNITLGKTDTLVNIVNNGTITSTGAFTNYSNLSGNNGVLNITGGSNVSGSITQGTVNIYNAYTNNSTLNAVMSMTNSGGITNNSDITAQILTNNGAISGELGNLVINNGGISNGEIAQNNITIGGSFENNKLLEAKNEFINNGTIKNNSTIKTGILTNNATISGTNGTLVVSNGGVSNGSVLQNSITIGGDFENNGTLEATKELITSGTITNLSDIKIGELTNTGNIVGDSGTLTINKGGINSSTSSIIQREISIKGTLENAGIIEAKDSLTNGGTIKNTNSIITNVINNTGTISGATGVLTINEGGKNTGTISQKEVILGGGNFTNNGTITIAESFTNNTLIEGTGTLNIKGGGANNEVLKQANITFSGADNTFTNNSNITLSGKLTNSTAHLANNSNITTGSLVNSGKIDGSGNLTINGTAAGSNSGTISQTTISSNGSFTNYSNGKISATTINLNSTSSFNNQGILGDNTTTLTNRGTLTNTGTVGNKTFNNTSTGNITNNSTMSTTGTFTNSGTLTNKKTITTGALTNNGTFINSGANATLDSTNFTNNKNFILEDGAKASLKTITNNASTGVITIKNGSSLVLSNQTGAINGTINTLIGENTMNLGNGIGANGIVNIGDGLSSTILNLTGGDITQNAKLNINTGSHLVINNSLSEVNLGNDDIYEGGIILKDGKLNANSQTLQAIDASRTLPNTKYYSQAGGSLNLINSTLIAEKNSITGGDINLDSLSIYTSKDGGFYLNNFKAAGELQAKNTINEDFIMTNMIIGDKASNDNQLDLTLDIYGRSNAANKHGSDRFIAENIQADAGLDSAVINIKDWTLSGDVIGLDAPIDRHIKLGNIFAGNIAENIDINVAQKEVFTPIGWYELKNNGGIRGNYSLSLARFNPQVYRGQVATVSQYMNQLLVNDMLLNHSMLLPSFKENNNRTISSNTNRYASVSPLYTPYQYSTKEGGLWYKMYGTFEKLQMNRFNVDNNAYGSLVGADLGLMEGKNGWNYVSTAYIGYNGGHQSYKNNTSMYQNGGQLGFMRTWYKDGLVIGGLVYGGVYHNDMDVAGTSENTVNYYVGASTKTAYNLRLNENWVIQPNMLLAYNLFGQQNWHTDYGQMSMMSGFLNGFNVAPGVNFIWERDTFSLYATLQYMFNICGSSDGRAGNVDLPSMHMDRGYLQYGIGINKSLTERSSGYIQTMFRNIGRTGVGFQLGFKYLLGY